MDRGAVVLEVIARIRRAIGQPGTPVALHEPEFRGNEWQYVKECIDTGWVSSVGKFVDRFEHDLAEYTHAPYAIAVTNGTAALHVCLILSGVEAGDEVLMPALTFVATANAISYCHATPHFVDIDERTLGISPEALRDYLSEIVELRNGECFNRRTGRRIKALVPMHTFGHPVDMVALMAVAEDFHLAVVEDAAESIGSYYQGRHTGTFAPLAALSFNGNKIVTTGGGGAILTQHESLAKRAKHLTTTAKVPHRWEFNHDMVGYNYRMPNINAALGCAQLESLPQFLEEQRRLFESYRQAFDGLPGMKIFQEPGDSRSNYWLQTLLLEESMADLRDDILAASNEATLMTRPAWTLMHRLLHFTVCPRMDLAVAESIEKRLINLPSSPKLARSASAAPPRA